MAETRGDLSVLMVGPKTYPPAIGGIETHVFEVSRRMAERGVAVEVAVPKLRGQKRSEKIDGVTVTRVACIPTMYTTKLTAIPGIVRLLRDNRAVVHGHDATGGFACAEFGRHSRFVYTMHGLGFHPKDWPTPFRQGIQAFQNIALRKANNVLCTDQNTASEISHIRPDAEVLPNGVDTSDFSNRSEPRPEAYGSSDLVVLFVGRLSRVKGVDTLLSAIEALEGDVRKSTRFVFIGDGPMRKDVEAAARGMPEIKIVGAVPHSSVFPFFTHADAYVLPSHSEGLPISLLEAMASGLPSIVSNVGGIKSQIDPRVVLSVPPGDATALSNAIALLSTDKNKRTALGLAGKDFVRLHFSWDRVVERLLEIYGT